MTPHRSTLGHDVLRYYAFSFLLGCYIASGTTVLFQREIRLSYSQIFTIEAVYMLTFILFEVPSGALADLVGRKRTIMLGCLLVSLGAVTTGLSNSFRQVLASNLLWACGFSCISGAGEALLYDRIGDEARYAPVLARSELLMLVGAIVAGVLGPWLFSIHFRYPDLSSAVPFLLSGAAIAGFHEPAGQRGFTLRNHIRQVRQGAEVAFRNRFVRWSGLLLALLFAGSYTMASAFQPYLQRVGFSVATFSLVLPVMALAEGLGDLSSPRAFKRMGEGRFVWLLVLVTGGTIALMGLVPVRISLAALLLFMFLQGLGKPFISVYSNRHIASHERATVLSVQSMIATAAASAPLFLFGILSDRVGVEVSLAVLGLGLLVLGALLGAARPDSRRTNG
jgi:MFS family permease